MKTIKRYFPFLILGPLSNILWAWWVLPEINEQGTWAETIQWISVQALLPLMFTILLAFRPRVVFWLLIIYSGFIILYGVGIFGWGLMGPATPVSVYAVSGTLFVMGFGLLYHSMKDLKFGEKERKDYAAD